MYMIPADIWEQYAAVLKKRAIPISRHADYRKWLRYYLDFRSKYPLPASRSEQVRMFINKLRGKKQSIEQQKQAAHALSLFFESQPRLKSGSGKREAGESELSAILRSPVPLSVPPLKEASPPQPVTLRGGGEGRIGAAEGKEERAGQRSGRRFNEWRCLEKSGSPAWDKIIDDVAAEIKTRHY
jgi:hypothetical protein